MMIKDLTLEEKFRLLAGKNAWEIENCGGKLYQVVVSDGPVGVRQNVVISKDENNNDIRKDLPAVAYPSIEVLSQTWNSEIAYIMGECLADDCIDKGVDVLLAPGVNIKRRPTCGRNFEYVSEDPFVAGTFAREYINGIQSKHVGATLKHYVANNSEIGRLWASSNVDERTMRELYLRNFEIALEAKPWAVMSSYNLLNGTFVSQDKKYVKILREDLKHGDNLIMSDWGAVRDHVESIKAGTDIEMPYLEENLNALKKAYENGEISIQEIDQCVERVLKFINKAQSESKLRKNTYTIEQRRQVAKEIEQEGIVLVKNNGILPIKDGQSVAITSQPYNKYYAGGGSARVVPEKEVETLENCLQNVLPNSSVEAQSVWLNNDGYVKTYTCVDGKDVVIVKVGFDTTEGNDRLNLGLKYFDDEEAFINAIARKNPNTIALVNNGGVYDCSSWIDNVSAVVNVGYCGEMGNEAIADILSGKVCPSGKLTETYALTQNDYPSEQAYRDEFNYNYEEKLDVGYRYFDKHPEKIRFPFGYGLSYTNFEYSNLKITKNDGKYFVEFEVKNVGNYDGAESSQVYVKPLNSTVEKPIKELRAFAKTYLKIGETKLVKMVLDDRSFSHFDEKKGNWVNDSGEYEICVAKHSQDICLTEKIDFKA